MLSLETSNPINVHDWISRSRTVANKARCQFHDWNIRGDGVLSHTVDVRCDLGQTINDKPNFHVGIINESVNSAGRATASSLLTMDCQSCRIDSFLTNVVGRRVCC